MVKKRLIAVVTVRAGWAVQSFGYKRYLPLGRPECLVENLDRWGADEILVQAIDRSSSALGPDFELLSRLGRLGLETPLIYGGGVSTAEHAVRAIQLGADRVVIDQALHTAPDEVRLMAALLGAQALIASVPITFDETIERYDYPRRKSVPFGEIVPALIADRIVSELMLIDWQNEGGTTQFMSDRIGDLPCPPVPLILFGGFTDPAVGQHFLQLPSVSAIAVGNMLSYSEHAYQLCKLAVDSDFSGCQNTRAFEVLIQKMGNLELASATCPQGRCCPGARF